MESSEYLRLVLNALHFLCQGTRPQPLLKAIVELRMVSEAGYMPNLAYCANCGAYQAERMYFKINRGELYCKSCYIHTGDPCAPLSPAALTAMRHIVLSDFEKIFSFFGFPRRLGGALRRGGGLHRGDFTKTPQNPGFLPQHAVKANPCRIAM